VSGSVEALHQAREIFARCGMSPFLEETDELLAQAVVSRGADASYRERP